MSLQYRVVVSGGERGACFVKKPITLAGALLLTLSQAVPAAAAEKVVVPDFSGSDEFEVLVSFDNPDWFGPFECSGGDIHCGGSAVFELTLWYKNGETDKFPDGQAWPWFKGQNKVHGIDYFSAKPGEGGKVASGKCNTTTHMTKHTLGVPETWSESNTGKNWGIQIPGSGTVHHESGRSRGTVTVTQTSEGPEFDFEPLGFSGNSTFEFDQLCAYFDLEPATLR
jgi:hypothetical protein